LNARAAAGALLLCLCTAGAHAHEVRPALLEMKQVAPARFDTLWKVPARGDAVLAIQPRFPDGCREATPPVSQGDGSAHVVRSTLECAASALDGAEIRIAGLEGTMIDVLVRIEFAGGVVQSQILKPDAPVMRVNASGSAVPVWGYLRLGIEHILLGIDHLLFVLGLLLIVRGVRLLVKTITAFTVAHSITLGLATLGFVHVPQAPVEAVIALSIVFVASELARGRQADSDVMTRAPWVVAFIFGLLHGFGFAGALSGIGLPPNDIPLALLLFNVGVEVGQLMFIGAVLALIGLFHRLAGATPPLAPRLTAYGIGAVSAYWVIERVGGILLAA